MNDMELTPGTITNMGVVGTDGKIVPFDKLKDQPTYTVKPGQPTTVTVPHPSDAEVPAKVLAEGMVLSVTVGATLNLGNYSNAKIEVQATDATTARKCFADEVDETVKLVQSTLKRMTK
jgi:hypothetical protein